MNEPWANARNAGSALEASNAAVLAFEPVLLESRPDWVLVPGDAGGVLSPKDLILHLIGDPYFREEQWREVVRRIATRESDELKLSGAMIAALPLPDTMRRQMDFAYKPGSDDGA